LGNSGDKVIVIDFDYLTTEKTVNGVTYSVYTHSDASTGANAELWVQKDANTTYDLPAFGLPPGLAV
jgi:hypothetical protein